MSCVVPHNNIKTWSVFITLINSKDTFANLVLPHASKGITAQRFDPENMPAQCFRRVSHETLSDALNFKQLFFCGRPGGSWSDGVMVLIWMKDSSWAGAGTARLITS